MKYWGVAVGRMGRVGVGVKVKAGARSESLGVLGSGFKTSLASRALFYTWPGSLISPDLREVSYGPQGLVEYRPRLTIPNNSSRCRTVS